MSGNTLPNGHKRPQHKRPFNEGNRHFRKNKKQKTESAVAEGSNEDVLIRDVRDLLERHSLNSKIGETSDQDTKPALPEPFTEIDLDIEELASTGDGLAVLPGTSQVVAVPFVAPGDRVTAKIIRHDRNQPYSVADFVKVVKKSSKRNDDLIQCQYFSKCSGCQFQMMTEEDQLAHKRTIVDKAYKHFSGLPASKVPQVGNTHSAGQQYGYRTKLTPHFDGPTNGRRDRRQGNKPTWESVPPIGFMLKGTRKTLDIEDCPIATDAVRKGMKRERKRVAQNIDQYIRGATLLCRQNAVSIEKKDADIRPDSDMTSTQPRAIKTLSGSDAEALGLKFDTKHPEDLIIQDDGFSYMAKTCITDPKAISTEYVGTVRYDNPAGAFFQNNEAILHPFLLHIKRHILCPPSDPTSTANTYPNPDGITHFVDAYCGSGLFSVFLADMFERTIGIDTSSQSIDFASRNAELNGIDKDKCAFMAGDAADIFAHVKAFPPDRTAVVLDPSRKGCDESFLNQLLAFAPKRVVYVSCNVHTQARDVGVLCGEKGRYEIESLVGWDFFPQTAHVEALAILKRKDDGEVGAPHAESAEVVTAGTVDPGVGRDEDQAVHVAEGEGATTHVTGTEWDGSKAVV